MKSFQRKKLLFVILFSLIAQGNIMAQSYFNTVSNSHYGIEKDSIDTPSIYLWEKEVEEIPSPSDAISTINKVYSKELLFSPPLKKIKYNSLFGMRKDPFSKHKSMHNGLDLEAKYEPAYAMMPGDVVAVGQDGRSGKYVTIKHGICLVSYCHLSQPLVTEGKKVRAGDVVAITGNTGRSTGAHLHLTCRFAGESTKRYIDPMIVLKFVMSNINRQ